MAWKLMLIAMFVFVFAGCGSSPKSDAETVCKCGEELVQMVKDGASDEELEKKNDECEDMAEEFESKYKEDKEKEDEFKEALDECGEEIGEQMDEALEAREED